MLLASRIFMGLRIWSGLAQNELSGATTIVKATLHIFQKNYRFRFLIKGLIFEFFFKKSKSHPFFEGFMHKIRLTSKKKCLKNPKFLFSSKSLQIHSKHQKSIPNHCATLGKWLGSIFDHLNEFKTTFGKSNFGAQKALFPYFKKLGFEAFSSANKGKMLFELQNSIFQKLF